MKLILILLSMVSQSASGQIHDQALADSQFIKSYNEQRKSLGLKVLTVSSIASEAASQESYETAEMSISSKTKYYQPSGLALLKSKDPNIHHANILNFYYNDIDENTLVNIAQNMLDFWTKNNKALLTDPSVSFVGIRTVYFKRGDNYCVFSTVFTY